MDDSASSYALRQVAIQFKLLVAGRYVAGLKSAREREHGFREIRVPWDMRKGVKVGISPDSAPGFFRFVAYETNVIITISAGKRLRLKKMRRQFPIPPPHAHAPSC